MGVSSCGDEITNEVVQQEPDNTLELLLGTWQGTGEAEGETLTFNKDKTYAEISENETLSGRFEYFPNRYMFAIYYTTSNPQLSSSASFLRLNVLSSLN